MFRRFKSIAVVEIHSTKSDSDFCAKCTVFDRCPKHIVSLVVNNGMKKERVICVIFFFVADQYGPAFDISRIPNHEPILIRKAVEGDYPAPCFPRPLSVVLREQVLNFVESCVRRVSEGLQFNAFLKRE